MLSNLLSNAMKFTPAGGEVRVTLRRQQDGVELAVEDSGYGIPTDHLPHIFDRFYRVPGRDSSGPERGLGLGLSFVSWIAKAHNGSVDVESTPGKAAVLWCPCPVSPAIAPQPADIPVTSGMNEL